ncbi:hypothetical protein [Nocardia sp. NBC_01388]|uniref:hypothetical protein n=1 Tax=Nocardia sp. NBC_01388 TaxID=2903596 RepID=UPI003244BE82
MADHEPEWSNPGEALIVGRRILTERGIDIGAAKLAFKSNHPQVANEWIETAISLKVAAFSQRRPPYTVNSVAEQMADSDGAYPWSGPVGNGLTLDHYRGKFRDYARDELFLMRQLGILGEDADHA